MKNLFTLLVCALFGTAVMAQQPVGNYWNDLNLITNWNFDADLTGWGGWVDMWDVSGQVAPVVKNGVVVMIPGIASDGNNWHYQHSQSPLAAKPDIPYTFKFKSWSSADAPCVVDFESAGSAAGGEQYNVYGASADVESINGRSAWRYTTTTEPTWFTFHVTFDQIVPATVQKVQWMLSITSETIYLDSVLLIRDTDLALYTGIKQLSQNSIKVYPNPVGSSNELTVNLSLMNAKVAIYNSLGQKMMEKVANGNMAKFNVSSLSKGMYFVRLSDGTSQKFIK